MHTQLTQVPEGQGERGAIGASRPGVKSVARRLAWLVPVAVLSVSVADIALYEVAGVIDPDVTGWAGAGAAQIIGANAVYLMVAAAALLVLVKITRAPARWFAILATIGVVASLALPVAAGLGEGTVAVPAPGLSTVIALLAMHLISYAIAVPMFLRFGPTRRG
ncbi:MAG: hypothetical protein WBG36_16660 [Ornithinimicrobium sp.]